MPLSASEIIHRLELEPLAREGGFFRCTYQTNQSIDLGKGYSQPLGTGIYFLLTRESFSAFHRLIEDEIYHFYLGDPVELLELSAEKEKGLRRTILGQDITAGQVLQHPVFKNSWHGSRLVEGGAWALLGTTMAPGFVWEDFELGNRDQLLSEYPEHKRTITQLTREQD